MIHEADITHDASVAEMLNLLLRITSELCVIFIISLLRYVKHGCIIKKIICYT